MIKLLLFMILAHIVDDFYLQGNLAKMKQKVWWRNYSNISHCIGMTIKWHY